MICNPQLWPKPTGRTKFGKSVAAFWLKSIKFNPFSSTKVKPMLLNAYLIFSSYLSSLSNSFVKSPAIPFINNLNINVYVSEDSLDFNLSTSEKYNLEIRTTNSDVIVNIQAISYYGARHGLETLSQLIWWDEYDNILRILKDVEIQDEPAFPHRGISVDTARNYFPMDYLKTVVEGMAANKLNVFHWHITDSQSFPFKFKKEERFAKFGAYKPYQVYEEDEIKEFVNFARIRGVRVIIEVDAPAHVNRGWEWGYSSNLENLIICNENTYDGQLNSENPFVLDVLEMIYEQILSLNTNKEMFHIGADEVDLDCWRNIIGRKAPSDMNTYWGEYMQKMFRRLKTANNNTMPKYIVMWSSPLTQPPYLESYLDKSRIVIQSWLGDIEPIVRSGYKIIFSTVGKWYLDCGFGRWKESAAALCDPYTTWHTFYSYTPWKEYRAESQTLGGEVCLWSEQVEVDSLQTRIWPRSAAFAERVWSNPPVYDKISDRIYTRLDTQRRRMVGRGIEVEGIWPQYCTQNPGKCI